MKTTKPKRTINKRKQAAEVESQPQAQTGGYQLTNSNPGLKEQVKAGSITAKQALATLTKKGTDAKLSNTYRWLQARASKEARTQEVAVEA